METAEINAYGRSFDEYQVMFALDDRHRDARILGVGDGPSNFNAEATRRGWRVVSVDPIYALSGPDLAMRCRAPMESMLMAISLVPSHWTWLLHEDVDALRRHRESTSHDFLADLESGAAAGRYVAAALPSLPLQDDTFDIGLCSHLLFAWSGALDLEFHRRAVGEMLRVCREVRVCPTSKNLGRLRSKYADAIAREYAEHGYRVRMEPLELPGASGAERMVITAAA